MTIVTHKPTMMNGVLAAGDVAAASMPVSHHVDVHETHTGVVVLAGDRAYKAKKPVLTDVLDFRTPEQRERVCRREIELNSRLSPESYLGIAHLSDPTDGPCEPIIVMQRYSDRDRLTFNATRSSTTPVTVSWTTLAPNWLAFTSAPNAVHPLTFRAR